MGTLSKPTPLASLEFLLQPLQITSDPLWDLLGPQTPELALASLTTHPRRLMVGETCCRPQGPLSGSVGRDSMQVCSCWGGCPLGGFPPTPRRRLMLQNSLQSLGGEPAADVEGKHFALS